MKGPEDSKGPTIKKPDRPDRDWSLVEKNPVFRDILRAQLIIMIMDRKFGEDFMIEYDRRMTRRGFEDEEGRTTWVKDRAFAEEEKEEGIIRGIEEEAKNPLVPEVYALSKSLKQAESIEEILKVAREAEVEITRENMEEARINALEMALKDQEF